MFATRSAMAGPATTKVIDTSTNNARPTVRASAVNRTRHHARPSVMSYAAFNVEVIESTAFELLQRVKRKANVRIPPALVFAI